MSKTQKNIIAKGSYNSWSVIEWLSILLVFILAALSVFLFSSEDLRTYTLYPGIATLVLIAYVIVRLGILGTYYVSFEDILWKSNFGKIHTVAYDDLGDSKMEYPLKKKPKWILKNKNGGFIKKFRLLKSPVSAGASILVYRYKDFLPVSVFDYWKPLKRGKRTYQKTNLELKINHEVVHTASGSITLFADRLLFIPDGITQALDELSLKAVRQAGFFERTPIYTPDENIYTHTLVEAILENDFPPAIRDSYLQKICDDNGAQVFLNMKKDGKQWEISSQSVTVTITRI